MRKLALFLTLICSLTLIVRADEPFRRHRFDALRVLTPDSGAILFVGNSITDMHPWCEAFYGMTANVQICNRGISGALSDEIRDNIGPFVACKPSKVFLMVGTNDLGSGRTPQQVALNVAAILDTIRLRSPETQIFIQSILPSTVGCRTLEAEQEANLLLRHIADTAQTVYIDLWDSLFGICQGDTALSLDGLHLTAQGYQHWCRIVAHHLGSEGCRYPESCAAIQQQLLSDIALWGSNAMRATYSMLPFDENDILFFGDEMVKGGEWQELLHNPHILNRGTGWGYDGTAPSIAVTADMARTTFKHGSTPHSILLYTGTGDVNSSAPLDSVFAHYDTLVDTLLSHLDGHTLYLVSLMPTTAPDSRILLFNDHLQKLARHKRGIQYVDIHTPLALDSVANPAFFEGNYLMGSGYLRVADILAPYLNPPHNLDYRLIRAIQPQNPFEDLAQLRLNRHWRSVSRTLLLSTAPTIGYSVGMLATNDDPQLRRLYTSNTLECAASLVSTGIVSIALKYIVRRPRPYDKYAGDIVGLQRLPDPSFPSGHTSFCFAAATSLTLCCPRWYVALPAFLWAGAVGYSRMYLGVHFPSDVLAGALIGTGCALISHAIRQRICDKSLGYYPLPKGVVIPVVFNL